MLVDHQLPSIFNPDVPIDDPEVLQEMQKAVSAKEKRSVHTLGHEFDFSPKGVVDGAYFRVSRLALRNLIPTNRITPSDVVYTLPLVSLTNICVLDIDTHLSQKLARKQNLASIDPWGGGNPYQLAIDTGAYALSQIRRVYANIWHDTADCGL